MSKIFIAEDDMPLRKELVRILQLQGFEPVVCLDFTRAASQALEEDPAVVILDLGLPGTDGLSICREIRSASGVPIVVLTSSDTEFDEVMSIKLGADDFVTKPYSPAVLLARIERLIQRSVPSASPEISYKGLTLDTGRSVATYNGASVELSRNELRILSSLIYAAGRIVSRQDLMYELWQSDVFIDDNTLTVNVNRLRKALSALGTPDDFLRTHRGQGYSL